MISNNYIPEKINDANAYLDGTRMIGVAASVDLPEINMKTGTVEGFGIGGEVDSPTIGQWESFEQAVQFNTLYSSAVDMLSPMSVVNLTFRAAQQVYDKSGGYDFKGLRVVEMARVKKFKPGKIEKSEGIFKSITFDNGTEFAAAEELERSCINKHLPRTKVYFCHPYSSWERGTNENTNGMIRRRFPKGTNFAAVTNAQITQAENWINNYPRKILGYKSSEIVFRECLRELGIAA